jgi:hypothetical protein
MSTYHPRFTARIEGSPETEQDHQIDFATALGEEVPDVGYGPKGRLLRKSR